MTISSKTCYDLAKAKGFHDKPREFGTVIALIYSEVWEAYMALVEGGDSEVVKGASHEEEENADVVIRIFDAIWEFWGVDFDLDDLATSPNPEPSTLSLEEPYITMSVFLCDALEASRKVNAGPYVMLMLIDVARVAFDGTTPEIIRKKIEYNSTRPKRHGKVF